MDLADIDLEVASARVGESFRIDVEDGSVIEFELVEVAPLTAAPAAPSPNQFSLLFRGPLAPVLNQGILPLNNEAWGITHIFVVPVEQDEAGTYYEAVFNRTA